MKRLIITVVAILVFMSSGVLYSSKLSSYQVVDVFICEEGIVLAEMKAKTVINRRELDHGQLLHLRGSGPEFQDRGDEDPSAIRRRTWFIPAPASVKPIIRRR